MRTTLALLLLVACDKTQDYKVEPVDSTSAEAEEADLDGDGYSELAGDCDDNDAAVHPDTEDGCDGVNNDCDLQTDEDAVWSTWYQDQDEDGYGDPDRGEDACAQPAGTVADGSDCNDHNAAVSPAAEESCDGMDDDCDGESDEAGATGEESWYADVDGDGFGDALDELVSCAAPDGYLEDATDCDDGDEEINPAALELCDEVDNDCNGEVDEDSAVDAVEWYEDLDGDGYGNVDSTAWACRQPFGYAAINTDCDDLGETVNPGSLEYCNDTDDDCDGAVDEADAADVTTWYADDDGDGYGNSSVSQVSCDLPLYYVADNSDCDDENGSINPSEDEMTTNAADDDCDGYVDEHVFTEWEDTSTYYSYRGIYTNCETSAVRGAGRAGDRTRDQGSMMT